jgi:hypothetical protein
LWVGQMIHLMDPREIYFKFETNMVG